MSHGAWPLVRLSFIVIGPITETGSFAVCTRLISLHKITLTSEWYGRKKESTTGYTINEENSTYDTKSLATYAAINFAIDLVWSSN